MKHYWFFFSYARLDSSRDPYLKKFYQELNEEVRRITGDDLEFIGFFDKDDIEPATQWSVELSEALQKSRAFVFVLSPTYVRKEYCGKEWQVFRERLHEYLRGKTPAPKLPPLMFPVLWVPESELKGMLPPVISDLQYDHSSFGSIYVAEGLQRLRKNKSRFRNSYNDFVNSLAKLIKAHALQHQIPPLTTLKDIKSIESAWKLSLQAGQGVGAGAQAESEARPVERTVGPRCVDVIYLAGSAQELGSTGRADLKYYGAADGKDWRPFFPETTDDVEDMVQGIVSGERMYATTITFDGSLIQRLEDAESNNRLVILTIDLWTIRHPRYKGFWDDFTSREFKNVVTLFIYGKTDDETTLNLPTLRDAKLEEFISGARASNHFGIIESVTSKSELEERLLASLSRMQMKVVSESPDVLKVESGHVVTKPIIVGPSANAL